MPQRKPPDITVYLNGEKAEHLIPISVQRSIGATRLDHAVIQVDLVKRPGGGSKHIHDRALGAANNDTITIQGKLDGKTFIYFTGQITKDRIELGDRREIEEFVARLEPFHFGQPFSDRRDYADAYVTLPIVFNEELDGRVFGNMRTSGTIHRANGEQHLFIDAEAIRTDAARSNAGEPPRGSGDDPNLWKLSDVIFYLCWEANPDEPTILNPSLEELQEVLDDDHDFVRDVHVPYGLYLPEALDHVLTPYGYSWFVILNGNADGPQIAVFRRGLGTEETNIYLQAAEEALDIDNTNMAECRVEFDVSTTYNNIIAYGDYLEIESTFTLQPGWDPAYDTSGADSWVYTQDLSMSSPDFRTGPLVDVGRKWVLNEAGDYEHLAVYDFSELRLPPEAIAIRRRRFRPCLTLGDANQPIGRCHGCQIEYKNSDGNWVEVPGEATVLHTECGVYFHGDVPPLQGFTPGGFLPLSDLSSAEIRITATVRFDSRLTANAQHGSDSPLGPDHTLVLDLPERFKHRYVADSSIFSADVDAGTLTAIDDNDKRNLQDYVDSLLKTWDTASLLGTASIEGIDDFKDDPPYEIGQSITRIEGRSIDFNTRPSGETAYPQIVGITYDFQRQRTILHLERFREPPRFLKQAAGFAER